jgi:carboxyl-terminal processing protease
MPRKIRLFIFLLSTPLVFLAVVGGAVGVGTTRQAAFPQMRVFDDVVNLIREGYVEPPDMDKVMEGAMRGLADSLDPSSAYLTPDEVKAVESNAPLGAGDTGLVVTRQFYVRVLGVRDGSPAARAGLRTGDVIRDIDDRSTRDMSAFSATRALRGAPGSKVALLVIRGNAAEPRPIELTRAAIAADLVTGKRLAGGEPYVRVASFAPGAAAAIGAQIAALKIAAPGGVIVDLRGTADGPIDEGIAAARHFVKTGTLATRGGRAPAKTTITAAAGDGALTLPVVLLVNEGTAGAAEVFAEALAGNGRAELVGGRTAGIAGRQHLVKLPEGRGLWLTYERYFAADGEPIQDHGLRPNVAVEEPLVPFDSTAQVTDDVLAAAITRLKAKK